MKRIAARTAAMMFMLLCTVVAPAAAQNRAADREGVRAAVLDYVEGFYQGDTTRFVRSVSPTVYKYGYSYRDTAYVGSQMAYAGFMSFANGVKAGRNLPPPNAPKDIVLLDVQNQTAAAKLTAWWGTDYLLLGKQDGRWMITHVLWQSPPPTEAVRR